MSSEAMQHEGKKWLRLLPFALFVCLGAVTFWGVRGDDLASSYVGCRVLATHQSQALYSYDPVNFAGINDRDTVWPRLAARGGYHGWLHPYVQTPLWAWALQPACNRLRWTGFLHFFLVMSLLAIAGMVYLTARFWVPALYTPGRVSFVLLLMAFSEPFLFAIILVQTHALLLLLALAGVILAERQRPVVGGLAVALAAAVKITPGVLLLYWVAGRRWRAAASLLAWSALLVVATRIVAGASLFHAYIESMNRVSHVLLVSEINQSLAAWYMGGHFSPDEVFDVNAFPLPTPIRLISLGALALAALLGGWLDREFQVHEGDVASSHSTHHGAALTLVAMTIFAPIAWSHYFIVMVVPLMLLAQAALRAKHITEKVLIWTGVVLCAAPLFRPLAPDVLRMDLSDAALLRGEFFAGLLCIVVLCLTAQRRTRGT